jgi:regulator of protease activity HflC (stomatin/prohibitin superfamily)
MSRSDKFGCIFALVIASVVLVGGGFWFHSASTTRHVDAGSYGIVIHYHSDGTKDVHVYPGGYQYSVDWFSNVKEFSYSAQVQTLKMFRSTTEGISPTADDIYCNDSNGVHFSGDLQVAFLVAQADVPIVYSQHQDLLLDAAPGTNGVDSTIAGIVVRPVLQAAWQNACVSRTYTDFEHQEYGSVESDILAYATPRLKAVGITLVSVLPQTIYLPSSLQDSLNAIAKANADNQVSLIAVQTAKNQAAALEIYRQEIAKDPALLKLLMLQEFLAKWDGHGVVPSFIANAAGS